MSRFNCSKIKNLIQKTDDLDNALGYLSENLSIMKNNIAILKNPTASSTSLKLTLEIYNPLILDTYYRIWENYDTEFKTTVFESGPVGLFGARTRLTITTGAIQISGNKTFLQISNVKFEYKYANRNSYTTSRGIYSFYTHLKPSMNYSGSSIDSTIDTILTTNSNRIFYINIAGPSNQVGGPAPTIMRVSF